MPTDDYAADLAELGPTNEQLSTVVELANRQVVLEDEIAGIESQLKAKNEELKRLSEADVPEALAAAGLESMKLTGGNAISIDTKIIASIPKASAEDAFAWLDATGHGDIVKRDVTVSFGKGDDSDAQLLLEMIATAQEFVGKKVADKKNVHPQTLGAFVREQLTAGTVLPDAISVFTLRRSVITRPKTEVPL